MCGYHGKIKTHGHTIDISIFSSSFFAGVNKKLMKVVAS